jgi:hypothetical protein
MRWSVVVEAEGDRVVTREEVVELADAVAASSGIAAGIGTTCYGAQIVVEAGTVEEAVGRAKAEFARAAKQAALPPWPITRAEATEHDGYLGVELGEDAE